MRRKVLFVINSLAGGGAERVMSTLLHGSTAQAERYDCVVALLDREEEVYTLPANMRAIRLDCRHGLGSSVRGLWRLVGEERPDVALSFLTRANVATAAAMAPRRLPFVLSERVNTTAHLGEGRHAFASKAMVRLAYPRASAIVAVSNGVADTLVEDFAVPRDRISVAANPIDTDHIEAMAIKPAELALKTPYVVAMGRLVPNKNFALAIKAFAASGLDGQLVILGQGPEREALQALADGLGVGDRVLLPGFAANPYAVIAGARFMALSSNAEGFPNALVEALACGVPVVATDCRSGPAEVLDVTMPAGVNAPQVGRGGMLVPVEDVDAMAAGFRQMADPVMRSALSTSGQARVRDFSVAAAVERYWSVIERAMDRRGPA